MGSKELQVGPCYLGRKGSNMRSMLLQQRPQPNLTNHHFKSAIIVICYNPWGTVYEKTRALSGTGLEDPQNCHYNIGWRGSNARSMFLQ